MKKLARKWLTLGLFAATAFGAVSARADDVVNVVALYATSGPAAIYGSGAEKAFRLMLDNLPNKTVNGHQIKFTVYDTEGNTTKAVQLFRRAVDNDNAQLIFGPSTSGEALALLPLANQLKVPVITNGGAETITRPATPYMFGTGPTDRLMAEAMVETLRNKGWKKVALIYSADGYGQSGGNVATELVKAAGLELVASETFTPQDTNMTPQLLRIKDANPDAMILWSSNPGPTIVAKNAAEMGFRKPTLVSTANATIGFVNQTGPAAEGIIATTLPVVAPEALDDSDPRKALILRFNKMFVEKYSQPSDQASGLGFDNFLLLEAALNQIKGPVTRDNLRNAIEGLKLCGANGCRQMRPDDHRGLTRTSMVMMQIKNGKFVEFK